MEEVDLVGCFDAQVWAKEFCKRNTSSDEGTMLGWFANAIMAGYDYAKQEADGNIQQLLTDTERLNKLESFLNNLPSNGIAIMPLLNHEGRLFSIEDLADEDGSNLGDELCLGKSLREVIDNLEKHNNRINLTGAG